MEEKELCNYNCKEDTRAVVTLNDGRGLCYDCLAEWVEDTKQGKINAEYKES